MGFFLDTLVCIWPVPIHVISFCSFDVSIRVNLDLNIKIYTDDNLKTDQIKELNELGCRK